MLNISTPLETRATSDRVKGRESTERLLAAAAALDPADRALLEAVYRDNQRPEQLADLRGESPRVLRRRVARLVNHLQSRNFRRVHDMLPKLPRSLQPVAQRCALQGKSLRQTAEETGLSIHQVRRRRDILRGLSTLAR